MDCDYANNIMRFLREASFETVAVAAMQPNIKECRTTTNTRPKSDYVSFSSMQKQESSKESIVAQEHESVEETQLIDQARNAITSWVEKCKHVTSNHHFLSKHEKKASGSTKFSCLGFAAWQEEEDDEKTVLTVCSAEDSQNVRDFGDDDNLSLLSDDSDRSSISVLREFRTRQRVAPFLPGEDVFLYGQYETSVNPSGVWRIQVYQPEEKGQSLRFELHRQGDDFAMTLYDTEIVDNVQALLEAEDGVVELIFQIRMGTCDPVLEVAQNMIINHLGLFLGTDQDHLESQAAMDETPERKEKVIQLWNKGDRRATLQYSANSSNSESPIVCWTMSQTSWRAKWMS